MSVRPIAIAALVALIASLAGCAVQGQSQGLFGAMVAPPPPAAAPAPAPMVRAPAPAPAPSGIVSVADATLQRDVMKLIATKEAAAGGSKQPVLVAARGTGKTGNTYVELWTINSNGALVGYEVKLTPAKGGGVDFSVARQIK